MSTLKGHQHAIFTSIFPDGCLRPPQSHKQAKAKDEYTIESLTATLLDDSNSALGVGEEDRLYSTTSKRGSCFRFFFGNVTTTEDIPSPTEFQQKNLLIACSKLPSWRQIPRAREQFGLPRLEKAFASVIDKTITKYIQWSYASAHSVSALPHLHFWVEYILIPYVSGYLNLLKGRQVQLPYFDQVQTRKWHDLALTRLAALRVTELFDVIVDWDKTSAVVDDLKHFANNPATRSYITSNFADILSTRLLHPGAATIEILTVYISIIRAFRRLDAKGVLLERVGRRIRRYLRERDDTIRVVVGGLLASPQLDESGSDPYVLHELAYELHQHTSPATNIYDTDLDFNNMEWQPDPIDAAPDYLKSKSTDVLGSVITLFDSKDTFIKELQVTLSDRLLKNKPDFDQEISVIEHLKIRFGDSALQACEVMLRDVLDSRKVDHVIRQDQAMNGVDKVSTSKDVQLHAKILSRLFWPPLQEQSFRVPLPVQYQQAMYEKGFENLKQSRKLTWLNAIGQVEVELELEDRTFHDEVLPWQASVIYAFHDLDDNSASRSITDLSTELGMTPALVRSACMFWSSHRVLTESSRDVFTVLDKLPVGTDLDSHTVSGRQDADAAAAEMAAAQAAREAEEAERKQKMSLYHQFIISMLTNSGAMPLGPIAMMLGIVVPGGFPFGNEELKEFLDGMVKEGVLHVGTGGSYKVVK